MSSPADARRAGRASDAQRRRAATAAWALVGAYVIGAGLSLWLIEQVRADRTPDVGFLAAIGEVAGLLGIFVLFAVLGAVIVSRRPRQPVGWLMLGAALAVMAFAFTTAYALHTIGAAPADPPVSGLVAAWAAIPLGPLSIVLGVAFLLLLYPDGRFPSVRWRPVVWAATAPTALAVAMPAVENRLTGSLHILGGPSVVVYSVDHPWSASWPDPAAAVLQSAVTVGGAALLLVAVASVVVRARRARGVERQQIKWLALAAALTGAVLLAMLTVGLATRDWPPGLLWSLLYLSLAVYPVAVGLAVLRYRLYDIDRIISRTVAYGLVLAVLGAVYVTGVVGLGAAVAGMTGEESGDLVVAASVLAVVALFGPVRSRVQQAVDRRFNRSGYEARLAVDAFTDGLRDEVDVDAIGRGVTRTAAASHQPAHVSIWLARTGDER